ncbi:MAG: amidohydrolase [Candidatus Obscuribacterales bacterium]|nr:amidohydrolase [Candidatus Obscuribacterales bacterium]
MAFDISKAVIIDNHAHSLLRDFCEMDEIGFRQCFTESRSMSMLQEHMPHSIHYTDLLDHLERIFNTRDESSFLEFRAKQKESQFAQMLWDDVSIGALIIDDGFQNERAYNLDELASISGRTIYHCKRMEGLIEESLLAASSMEEAETLFQNKLKQRRTQRMVSLKTICGYRGGLQLLQPTKEEALRDFDKLKRESADDSHKKKLRIEKRPVYHQLLLQGFELAAELNVPVQVHCGIGDDDADLIDCNPALMQSLFRARRFSKTQFVLLHCFPYVREAGFLCSLYSNVFMDLSLSISLSSARGTNMISDALAIAPSSKILAGTDGHSCPESHWYGALCWKRGLTGSLFNMINAGLLTQREAEETGELVLHGNAIRLYRLEGLA